jgi:hypothetical protein
MDNADLLISLEEVEAPSKQEVEPVFDGAASNENLLDQPLEVLDPFAMGKFEVLKPTLLVESSEGLAEFDESAPKQPTAADPRASTVSAVPSETFRSTTISNRKSASIRSVRPAQTVKHASASSRLNPTPPQVLPIHYNLPTRKWVDLNTFSDIPVVDKLSETISKAFSHQPSNQRPQKTVLTLSKALDTPDPYATLIAANR